VRRFLTWAAVGCVGVVVIAAVAGCAESTGSGSADTTADKAASTAAKTKSSCGIKATDDCTPRVSMGRRVRVDALYWNVTSVHTRKSIGDMQYGLGAKADGTFIVVGLKVHSAKDDSATLTDKVVQLETADGKKYDPDNDGTVAAIGDGQDPLFIEDVGPDATVQSKVVFDVPRSALHNKLSVRFNELGFGTTHGYIKLPAL
jgi:Domain of unknown function (DUF4352)